MAGIPLPAPIWRRVLRTSATYDIAQIVVGIPATWIAAQKLVNETGSWWFLVAAVALIATGVVKGWLAFQKDAGKDRVHAMEGALHTLHRVLVAKCSHHAPRLRLTIHCPDKSKAFLTQVMDYVGDQRASGRTAGRRTRAECGVIGEALRTKQMAIGSRGDSASAYVEELQKKWHYSEKEALALNMLSQSWLALPLKDAKNEVQAVLFADSVLSDFFTEEIVDLALSGATGVAEFVSKMA